MVVFRICRWVSAAAVALALGGCVGPARDPGAEGAIDSALGAAVGAGGAVVFRSEGGPVDEPVVGMMETLSAAEAVRLAVSTDPRLQGALARVRMALAEADQARLLPNPVLNIIFKFPEGGITPNIEAELAGEIVAVLQRPRRAGAADNRLRASAAGAVTVALDVVKETRERYVSAQGLEELLGVLEGRRAIAEKLVGWTRARVEAGEGARGDITTLEAQGVELEVEIAERRGELRDERLALARLIGRPSDAAEWRVEKWAAFEAQGAGEAEWVRAGLANRPEMRAVGYELAALGDEAGLVSLSPLEGAGGGVGAERDGGKWAAGPAVTVPIPVFDTGQARRAKVSAEQAEARHRLTGVQRGVVEEVRRAYAEYAAAVANLERVRGELLPRQEERRRQAEEMYRAGLGDTGGVFLAEHELQRSLAKRVELERAAAGALVALERAVGGAGPAGGLRQSGQGGTNTEQKP